MATTKPKTTKTTRRAAIYARLSQDRTGESLGIERQTTICTKLAQARGWEVTETYVDRDLSAFKETHRPGFEQLRADVRAGRVDAVLAVDQDRLSRRLSVLAELVDELGKLGVPIVVDSGEIDTTSSDGVLRAQLLGMVAEHESRKKSERVRRQRDQAAERGVPAGGRRPYGYEQDGMTVREAEADLVREGVRRYLAGESMRGISVDWNSRGVLTAGGGTWNVSVLRTVLANPRYAGLRVHRGDVVGAAAWPAVISRADHERVVRLLGDPRRVRKGRPPARLLSSMLRCGRCGSTLHVSRRSDGAACYQCGMTPGRVNCGGIAVAAEPVEACVEAALLARIDTPKVTRAIAKKTAAPKTAGDDLGALEADLAALSELFGSGNISRREWLAARTPLLDRVTRAQAALTPEAPALEGFTGPGATERWAGLNIDRRRAILGALVEAIVVNPAPVPGRRTFNPDRLDIQWKS
jgi:DNA invertase Pin-like site-specific DNA recombinase